MNKKISAIEYKWIVISLCFIMIMICLGFCSSSKGLYLSPITEALGIKRSAFSIGDSIRYISSAVINIFFGVLVSKYGTKKLICAGIGALIIYCLIYSFAASLVWFYIAGIFAGIGFSWTTTTMVGVVVNRWFTEKKGTIMGAVLASNGIGAAVAAQILTPVIYMEGVKYGYRNAFLLTVILLVIILILMILFFKEKTGAIIEKHDGNSRETTTDWEGIGISTAKRSVYFYLAIVCVFFFGMALQGITGIAMAHMKDTGISAGVLGTIASVHMIALSAAKFLVGYSYDKFGLKITAFICNFASVLAMLLLAFSGNSSSGLFIAFAYSIVAAVALPLETVMIPIFVDDLFGHKSYEQILGLFVSVCTAGFAVGTPLMNAVYDTVGTYKPVLLIFAVIMFVVMMVFMYVINASYKFKNQKFIRKDEVI